MLQKLIDAPKIAKVLTLQQFFEGYVPIMALYVLLFDREGGLTFEQIGWLFSAWSLSYLIAELPSGVLADYWSRKKVIMLGALFKTTGFVIWLVWPTFWGYLIGFILWGFMIACSSGSTASFLRTELEVVGKKKQFTKYFGYMSAGLSLGYLFGYATAAILTLRYANTLILLSAVSAFMSIPLLLLVKEANYSRQNSYLKTLLSGFREVRHSKKLRLVSYILFSVFMIYGVLEEYAPRIYSSYGLSDTRVSVFVGLTYLFSITFLVRLERYVKIPLSYQTAAISVGLFMFIASFSLGGFAGSLLLVGFGLLLEFLRALFQHHIQETVEGNEKATISSIPGLAGGLLGALAYIVIGNLSEVYGEYSALKLYGAFWIVVTLSLSLFAATRTKVIR